MEEKLALELFPAATCPETELEKNEADCAADEPLFVEPDDKNDEAAVLQADARRIMDNDIVKIRIITRARASRRY